MSIYEGGRGLLIHISGQERYNIGIERFNYKFIYLYESPNENNIPSICPQYKFKELQNSYKRSKIFPDTVGLFATYFIMLFYNLISQTSILKVIKNSKSPLFILTFTEHNKITARLFVNRS